MVLLLLLLVVVAAGAKLPHNTPLDQDQILIYAMLGPWCP